MKKPNFFIISGEPSGELHGGLLMAEIRKICPDAEFTGIGGKTMIENGLKPIISIDEMSVVGFWEVAKKYLFFKKILNKSIDMLSTGNYTAFIPIDYPGFNILLARKARQLGIPVYYYIAPQLWAWGKKRAKKLKKAVDILLTVFPFEKAFFGQFSIRTEFVGHPILDDPDFNPKFFPQNRAKRIAFLPGSRKQEIKKHLPIIEKTIQLLRNSLNGYEYAIARPTNLKIKLYEEFLSRNSHVIVFDNSRDLMKSSEAGLVKTGTSNLEAALCNMPFAMFYRTSSFSYLLGKQLVKLPWLSIVNIITNRTSVREFIQQDATPEKLAEEILKIINNSEYKFEILNSFEETRNYLGSQGASEKAANVIISDLRIKNRI